MANITTPLQLLPATVHGNGANKHMNYAQGNVSGYD